MASVVDLRVELERLQRKNAELETRVAGLIAVAAIFRGIPEPFRGDGW